MSQEWAAYFEKEYLRRTDSGMYYATWHHKFLATLAFGADTNSVESYNRALKRRLMKAKAELDTRNVTASSLPGIETFLQHMNHVFRSELCNAKYEQETAKEFHPRVPDTLVHANEAGQRYSG